jgi:hypothetical protein
LADLLHHTEILDRIAVENQEIGFVILLQLPDLSLTIATARTGKAQMELAGFAFDFKCNHLHARTNPVPPVSPNTAAAIGWVPLLWPAKCFEDDLGTSTG